MKNLVITSILVLLANLSLAQDKLYLVFEFMQVDNEQEASYAETEEFWQKIHGQPALLTLDFPGAKGS